MGYYPFPSHPLPQFLRRYISVFDCLYLFSRRFGISRISAVSVRRPAYFSLKRGVGVLGDRRAGLSEVVTFDVLTFRLIVVLQS